MLLGRDVVVAGCVVTLEATSHKLLHRLSIGKARPSGMESLREAQASDTVKFFLGHVLLLNAAKSATSQAQTVWRDIVLEPRFDAPAMTGLVPFQQLTADLTEGR